MRRKGFAAAALLALAGTWFLCFAPAVAAVSAPTSAWWTRLATTTPTDEVPAGLPVPGPTTPDTLPVGATVPEGQLLVEGAPDGPTAIAAIRWQLDDGESSPSLTLTVGEGSTINPESVVLACRTATAWEPPEAPGGSWNVRPLADASTCVNGIVADDLSTVSFGIQPLVSGDVLDIVLTPGKTAAAEVPAGVPQPPADVDGSTFRLLVDAPTPESLEVVAGDFSQGSGDQFVAPETSDQVDFGSADTGSFDTGAGGFDAGAAPEVEAPVDVPEEVAAPEQPQAGVRDAVPALAAGSPANRTIGFVLLGLAGLMAAWTYMTSATDEPTTIGLGRFKTTLPAGAPAMAPYAAPAEPAVGGLGRFSRTRTRPPTPLA